MYIHIMNYIEPIDLYTPPHIDQFPILIAVFGLQTILNTILYSIFLNRPFKVVPVVGRFRV